MRFYDDAVNDQIAMLNFFNSDKGYGYAKAFIESTIKSGQYTYFKNPVGLVNIQKEIFTSAAIFTVSEDMMTLINYAAETAQEEALLETDIITPMGVVYLPRPVRCIDVHDKAITWSAFSWKDCVTIDETTGAKNKALFVTLYTDKNVPDDDYNNIFKDEFADIFPDLPRYTILHMQVIPYNTHMWESTHDRSFILHYRFIWSFFRLSMQTITEVTGERVSRAVRKRILREGSKIQQDTVNVVKLRREYQKDDSKESKSGASYQHRFIVSGHWRNQFYPSIKTNRQIWIDSYIKGDPEKELVFKKRVFDFSK